MNQPRNTTGRVLIASLAGTTIEFFDFYIYATAAVLVFPRLFFPAADPASARLQSLATFALAFFARPVGSVVFGHFGDRIGRKATLVAALLTMGVSTVGIGLLPPYAAIGLWAPALLSLLRFGQGFGLGGEWGGAVLLATENAPPGRRALYGMFPQLGAPIGFLFSSGIFLGLDRLLNEQQFLAWGWRLPFIASSLLVIVGLYVRLSLHETPDFARTVRENHRVNVPVLSVCTQHAYPLLLGTLATISTFVVFYLMTTFALSWGTSALGYTRTQFLLVQMVGVVFFGLTIPVSAWLAERRSSFFMLALATVGIGVFGLWMAPLFSNGHTGALAFMCLGMALTGLTYGPLGTALAQLFPTPVRYTGSSMAFNLAGILGASLAPYLATWLAQHYGLAWVGYYLTLAAAISLLALLGIRGRLRSGAWGGALLLGLLTSFATPHAAQAASLPAVEASRGMVVSAQHLASDVGVEILKAGGNAVDAAVAVGYAQAVTNPCCGNIGGGGFMLIHLAQGGRDIFLNFRETAPAAATPDMYLDAGGRPVPGASLHGWRAVAVPGTVLGLDTALRRYGSLPRATVMAPAIRLAREGFILGRGDTDIIDVMAARLKQDPEAARNFFRPDGSPLRPGDRLVQPQLARTLEAIARGGSDAFYKSDSKAGIAARIDAAMRANGGLITARDLASYTVTESAPLYCDYRGYRIASAPPPSSGGITLCEILNILSGYDLSALGFHSAASVHYLVEAMRHAYVDRNSELGDPAFVHNPVARLLDPGYAAGIRNQIDPERASSSQLVKPGAWPHEKPETTHYSIADAAGNAVSVTYTINGFFGAGVSVPGTGFFLNNEMDDFTVKAGVPNMSALVQGDANAIAPGKRPLSSMAPTLVMKDGRVFMVLGSPGASRIITITLQVLLNVIDYGMEPQEAVDAPRIHHQWLPDVIFTEPRALSPDTVQLLQARGYQLREQPPWGAAELILIPQAASVNDARGTAPQDARVGGRLRPGLIYGANDARRQAGSAAGY